jgi:ELWxxDGT repeat protein
MKRLTQLFIALQLAATAQVPFMLKDITPGTGDSYISDIHLRPNNEILFAASNTTSNTPGVFRSDGSTQGTYPLRPLISGGNFVEFNGLSYFTATKAGLCLWRTNGQVSGTDSLPTPGLQNASKIYNLGSRLVFTGSAGSGQYSLWSSDGTTAGTFSLITTSTAVTVYTVTGGNLFFSVPTSTSGIEMWRTDGTAAGTFQLKDIWPGAASSLANNPFKAVSGNRIFFLANDGTTGSELYTSDGTTAGTYLLKDINPGTASSYTMSYYYGTASGVFFMAFNNINGTELWYSDGTTANTQLIREVGTGTLSAIPCVPTFTNGFAYYFYNNVGGKSYVYKSDGSSAGTTTLVVATLSNNVNYIPDSRLWLHGSSLYFVTHKYFTPMAAMSYDSIYVNKVNLSLTSHTIPTRLKFSEILAGSFLYYAADGTTYMSSHLIYQAKGSNSRAILVVNLGNDTHKIHYNRGHSDLNSYGLTHLPVGNKFYFPFVQGDHEPAYLDLSNDSIYQLKNVNPGGEPAYTCGSGPHFVWHFKAYNLNNKSYFLANEPGYGLEFFGTDYTSAGTSRVLDINPGSGNYDNDYMGSCSTKGFRIWETPNNIYFIANNITNGMELWAMVSSSVTPPPPNSVSEVAANSLRLYPNPSSGKITVACDDAITYILVTDVAGAKVREFTASTKRGNIDCTGLPQGMYFVTVNGASWTKTMKVLIE